MSDHGPRREMAVCTASCTSVLGPSLFAGIIPSVYMCVCVCMYVYESHICVHLGRACSQQSFQVRMYVCACMCMYVCMYYTVQTLVLWPSCPSRCICMCMYVYVCIMYYTYVRTNSSALAKLSFLVRMYILACMCMYLCNIRMYVRSLCKGLYAWSMYTCMFCVYVSMTSHLECFGQERLLDLKQLRGVRVQAAENSFQNFDMPDDDYRRGVTVL